MLGPDIIESNMYGNGYVKDAAASLAFLCMLLTFALKPAGWCPPKMAILLAFALGFTVDGLFTFNPEWHCRPFVMTDAPGSVVIMQTVILLCIFYIVLRA